jgi:DNA repair protein RecO
MSHHIYHTQGFILGSAIVGEANRYITIFTRELGVIGAVAQGIRKIDSKLRYALQDYSYARVDVIRGKHSWRITSAQPQADFAALGADPEAFALYAKLLGIIRRLCSGEEPNEILYAEVHEAFLFLNHAQLSSEARSGFELVFLIRLLHNLGHMQPFARLEAYLGAPIDEPLCIEAHKEKSVLVREINTALKESQL